jgi:hypothetical protein
VNTAGTVTPSPEDAGDKVSIDEAETRKKAKEYELSDSSICCGS